MNVFDHIGRFYSADVRLADELTARTGDRLATHSGLVRCQFHFFFKIGSSFVQNPPHRRTFSRFGYLSSFFIPTLPTRANATALAPLALRPIVKDTALCNKIQKGVYPQQCGSWRPIGSQVRQKLLVQVCAEQARQTSFFALLPIFPNCVPKGARRSKFFGFYAFEKGKLRIVSIKTK